MIFTALFPPSTPITYAGTLEDELAELQRRAEEAKSRSAKVQEEMVGVATEIQAIDQDVAAATTDLRRAQSLLAETDGKIEETEEELEDKRKKLLEKVDILKKRVRDIYMHGQVSYLDVLFGANDFADLVTRLDLWKRVVQHDYNLVKAVMAEREKVEALHKQLLKQRADRKAIVDIAAEREATIVERRERKQAMMDALTDDRDSAEAAYQELMAASREVEMLIRRKQLGGEATTGAGSMIWPLVGPITSEYGWRIHPITGDQRYHSGMDIAGDYGDPIVAAASGTVIHSGWISGYGYTIILDHGGGITTLYAHNQSLAVGVGERVRQGEVISYCGSTGNSTGPHCHFEVRIDGELTEPYDYLP